MQQIGALHSLHFPISNRARMSNYSNSSQNGDGEFKSEYSSINKSDNAWVGRHDNSSHSLLSDSKLEYALNDTNSPHTINSNEIPQGKNILSKFAKDRENSSLRNQLKVIRQSITVRIPEGNQTLHSKLEPIHKLPT